MSERGGKENGLGNIKKLLWNVRSCSFPLQNLY